MKSRLNESRLHYSFIQGVRRVNTLLGPGFVVEHNFVAAPQPVVIWTSDESKLIDAFGRFLVPLIGIPEPTRPELP